MLAAAMAPSAVAGCTWSRWTDGNFFRSLLEEHGLVSPGLWSGWMQKYARVDGRSLCSGEHLRGNP